MRDSERFKRGFAGSGRTIQLAPVASIVNGSKCLSAVLSVFLSVPFLFSFVSSLFRSVCVCVCYLVRLPYSELFWSVMVFLSVVLSFSLCFVVPFLLRLSTWLLLG